MNLTRWEPYREIATLQDRLNRAFGSALGRTERDDEMSLAAWAPPVDIAEEKDRIVITAELPGFQEDQIEIQSENGMLTLRGERKFEKEHDGKSYHRVERSYGQFVRSFIASEQRGPREDQGGLLERPAPRRASEAGGRQAPDDPDLGRRRREEARHDRRQDPVGSAPSVLEPRSGRGFSLRLPPEMRAAEVRRAAAPCRICRRRDEQSSGMAPDPGRSTAAWSSRPPRRRRPLSNRRTEIVLVVEKVAPAVVNISAEQTLRQRPSIFDDFFFGSDGRQRQRTSQSLGSGAIIDPKGHHPDQRSRRLRRVEDHGHDQVGPGARMRRRRLRRRQRPRRAPRAQAPRQPARAQARLVDGPDDRRDDRRDRQPVRPVQHRHGRSGLGQGPQRPRRERPDLHRLHPDRRLDQPGQLRRTARQHRRGDGRRRDRDHRRRPGHRVRDSGRSRPPHRRRPPALRRGPRGLDRRPRQDARLGRGEPAARLPRQDRLSELPGRRAPASTTATRSSRSTARRSIPRRPSRRSSRPAARASRSSSSSAAARAASGP